MICIKITDEAYEALKVGNPHLEDQASRGQNGQLRIWVDRRFLDELLAARRPGENYSDVILRLARG
jgi:predicted CopG family antitoxin